MFLKQSLAYKNPFWFYFIGSFVVLLFIFLGQLPITFFISEENLLLSGGDPLLALRNLNKNLQLFLLLIPFAFGFLGLLFVVNKLHDRDLRSISTSRKNLDWKRVLFAFIIWGGVIILLSALDYFLFPENYKWNFNPKKFTILFLIAIFLIPIQSSFEEYFFRGYLMQGFNTIFRNPFITLSITSIIFGFLHWYNPEVQKLGYGILTYYVGTGFFLGIITLMDDGIELALGFHAANNFFTALIVTSSWTAFQTESILIDISVPSLGPQIILPFLVFYPLFIGLMSIRYSWSEWKNKIISKI